MRLVIILLMLSAVVLGLGAIWRAGTVGQHSAPTGSSGAAPSTAPPGAAVTAPTRPGEVTFEITETELSQDLSQQLVGRPLGTTPLGDASIDSINVTLRDGQGVISGDGRLGGVSVPFSSTLTAAPDGAGGVRVSVTAASLSGVALPGSARNNLEDALQRQLNRLLATRRMRVRTVDIGGGRLRAFGTPA
jgi:hypothetical protein